MYKGVGAENSLPHTNRFKDAVCWLKTKRFRLPSKLPDETILKDRNERFVRIFTNNSDIAVTPLLIVSFFSGIVLSLIFSAQTTMWPIHNAVGNSKYWYENIITWILAWEPFVALFQVNTCLFYLGTGGLNSLTVCIKTWMVAAPVMFIFLYLQYVLWVYVGGLVWPLPFAGYWVGFVGWLVVPVMLWLQFPKEWKLDPQARKKLIAAVLLPNTMAIGEVIYKVMLWLFQNVDENYQWTLAFLLVTLREVNTWILSFVGHKIAGKDDVIVEIVSTHYAAIKHILFLSVNLVNATPLTSYLILGADFCINLVFCAEILWYVKNPSVKNDKRKEIAILTLIMNETVEFIMPIIYSICLLVAYVGPNAHLIGNVKSDWWQYVAIDDINITYFWIAIMFLVDVASTVITTSALKIWGKMNIVKACIQMQKEIGWLLALQQAYLMTEYLAINVVSNGMDATFGFDWLKDNGNVSSIGSW